MEQQPVSLLASPLEVFEALQTPTRPVRLRFLLLLTLGVMVLYLGFNGIGSLLVPAQIDALDPAHKIADLGAITSIGALMAVIANLLSGTFSDRTTALWGRRRPWVFAGALGSAVALAVLMQARNVFFVGLGVALYQCFGNMTLAPLTALVPDRVPESQRGIASGLIGLGFPFGSIIAAILIGSVIKVPQTTYLVMILILLAFFVPFALLLSDQAIPQGTFPAFHLFTFLKGFWISPRAFPDFAWAFVVRFIPVLGYYVGTSYLFYYLQDSVGYQRLFPGQTALQGASTVTLISTVTLVVALVLGGVFSDRLQRRKPFVIGSLLVMAVALLLYGFFPTWPVVMLASALQGFALGAYLAVDLALTTLVLPSAQTRGKDLGIMNIAFTLPISLAPALCGVVLSALQAAGPHISYAVLFLLAALLSLLGIFAVLRIRGVK